MYHYPYMGHVKKEEVVMKTYKNGFTLAEVLITLGIIGIVAAMTLPSLIQKKQDRELISQTKKVFADINNAFLLSQQDYGVIGDNSFLFNETDEAYTIAKNLAKYFNGAKVCEKSSQKGCSQYYYDIKYATLRLDSNNSGAVATSSTDPKIILSNGAIIRIATNKSGCAAKEFTQNKTDDYGRPIKNPDGTNQTTSYISTICANLFFDVNGSKQPNQFGRDVYWFWVMRKNLEPASKYVGGDSLKNILTGKDKLEYENYSKGQTFEF